MSIELSRTVRAGTEMSREAVNILQITNPSTGAIEYTETSTKRATEKHDSELQNNSFS